MEKANDAEWWHTIEAALGDPPDSWELWTNTAETGLLNSLGIPCQGGVYRGGPIRYKDTTSRPQDGKYGIGTNKSDRRININAARQDRYWLLGDMREGDKERQYLTTISMQMARWTENT